MSAVVEAGIGLVGLKIAIDGRYARRPGMGIHYYLLGAVELLTSVGADVVLLLNPGQNPVVPELAHIESRYFGSSRNIIWEQRDLPRHLRSSRDIHMYWAPGNTGVPLRSVPVPVAVTIHDLLQLRLARTYLLPRPGYAIPYLVWTLASLFRSDLIITSSHSSQQDIKTVGRRVSRVVAPLLSESQAPSRARMAEAELRPEMTSTQPYVLYNGGKDRRKNVPVLIEAFAALRSLRPDVRLVLLGSGYESYDGQIRALGCERAVVRPGYVSEVAKLGWLRGAALLAYPSSYEGFGLPLVEGFAAGIPVVTCSNSSLLEVAGPAAIYAKAGDAEGLTAAMLEALVPERRAEMVANGYSRLEGYSPEKSQVALLDALTSLATS